MVGGVCGVLQGAEQGWCLRQHHKHRRKRVKKACWFSVSISSDLETTKCCPSSSHQSTSILAANAALIAAMAINFVVIFAAICVVVSAFGLASTRSRLTSSYR